MDISEKNFETSVEAALLAGGPDEDREFKGLAEPVAAYGSYIPGGFRRRRPGDYDISLALDSGMTIAFIQATQPKKWTQLNKHYGADVRDKFLKRLSQEVEKRGVLDVLRKGIKDMGVALNLAYFRPSSGLNPDLQTLYEANIFTIVRQLRYSTKNTNSIDVAIFLNGLPIFTAELKNPLNGQNYRHAIAQYQKDRDPKEKLLTFGHCLAHFAVDPELVYVTTHLQGGKTRFLPFNKGKYGGAGNPPDIHGFATRYLWEHVWSKDSIVELIQRFIHVVEEEDDKGRKTGKKTQIFPRYHQLDAVRGLVDHARANGTGNRYLIQHSAGSGKSNSISWLAHQLSVLHDIEDRRVFDSIIVITDRRVLDRQLQRTIRQFEQTVGVVENIDKTSRQLKEALESGKTIIVTTLQKFPQIVDDVARLPGKRFAVIIDEAHSSQSGETTSPLKRVLAAGSLEEAEHEDAVEEPDAQDRMEQVMRSRGPVENLSLFAFTATPKQKTMELFGTRQPDGSFTPFSLYSMRQAIEEGFILDVLNNYTTYRVYWSLLKRIQDDPHYDRSKAGYLARRFVDLHEHSIGEKVEIIAEHFHQHSAHRIAGRAKAMVVTRSRLHAVRTFKALQQSLKQQGMGYKALVAFSGSVADGATEYTEPQLNGFAETQTATVFKQQDYRFLVVAEKFQTGFDEPLLHTMYVDKKLHGLHAVQTLSRLNRVHPDKEETLVLDFANEAEEIQAAFEPYYEKTILSEGTDPNLLYDHQRKLLDTGVFDQADLDAFALAYFGTKEGQDTLYQLFSEPAERFRQLSVEEQADFKSQTSGYVRLYSFLTQIATFVDADLEKLYQFSRHLLRKLADSGSPLPMEVQGAIEMDSFRIQESSHGSIALGGEDGRLKPISGTGAFVQPLPALEPLSQIIQELNERFGTDFEEKDRVFVEELLRRLADDPALEASVRANTPDNARLTFDHVVTDRLQEMVETNFDFYKRVTDDERFGKFFNDWLFQQYTKTVEKAPPGPKPPAMLDVVVDAIVKELKPRKVILFGSGARNEMTADSDLDLLVVLDQVENLRRQMAQGSSAIGALGVSADLVLVSQQDVNDWGHVVGHVINEALVDGRTVYDAA